MTLPHTLTQCLRAALLLLAIGLSAGCVQLRQELTLRSDNTGDFALRLALPADRYDALVESEHAAVPSLKPLFDPGQGAAMFPEADGFVVTAHRVYTDGEWRQVSIEGRITDLRKALASGRLGRFTLATNGDRTTLRLDPAEFAALDPADSAGNRRKQMAELLRGLHIQLVIRPPADIKKTSATDHEDRVAVWTYDLEKHDDFLEKRPDIHVSW